MFGATDTPFAPWFVVRSDDKRRARLNLIRHLLAQVPAQELPRETVALPKRQVEAREPSVPLKFIDEVY
jgi:hypothetical protein